MHHERWYSLGGYCLVALNVSLKNLFNGVLGQWYPADNANHILVEEESTEYVKTIHTLMICNTTGGGATFRVFLGSLEGAVAGNALFYDTAIAANTTTDISFDSGIGVNYAKSLIVQASAANTLTFTAFGSRSDGN